MGLNSSTAYFSIIGISFQKAEITGVVLTGRFSSLRAIVLSACCPLGKANQIAVYQF